MTLLNLCIASFLACHCLSTLTFAVQPQKKSATPAYVLIAASASVRVLRGGSQREKPVKDNTLLFPGDTLRIPNEASASVVSPDLKRLDYGPGEHSLPPLQSARIYKGVPIGEIRGADSSLDPIIITPRMTLILNNRPTIRWRKAPRATDYTVSLSSRGKELWAIQKVTGTSLQFPAQADSLAAKESYTVTVTASILQGGRASSTRQATTSFRVLSLPSELQASLSAVDLMNISQVSKDFLNSKILAGYREMPGQRTGFYAEAIEKLERLLPAFDSPQMRLELSELYLAIGLIPDAQMNALRGVSLARRDNDLEGQAWLLRQLGRASLVLGSDGDAMRLLGEARRIFRRMGDSQGVSQLGSEINCVSHPENPECTDFPEE